jgi:hypothetical protein
MADNLDSACCEVNVTAIFSVCTQHDLKKGVKEKLVKKLMSDPELAAYVQNFISISILTPDTVGRVGLPLL